MRYTTFGRRTGLRVSEYALGTANFGTGWGAGAEPDEARRIFDRFAEAGGTFLDSADSYLAALDVQLTDEQYARLDKVSAMPLGGSARGATRAASSPRSCRWPEPGNTPPQGSPRRHVACYAVPTRSARTRRHHKLSRNETGPVTDRTPLPLGRETTRTEMTMKAFMVEKYGDASNMRAAEIPDPQVGADDVLVRIDAASVNPLDMKIRDGDLKAILPTVSRSSWATTSPGPSSRVGRPSPASRWATRSGRGPTRTASAPSPNSSPSTRTTWRPNPPRSP